VTFLRKKRVKSIKLNVGTGVYGWELDLTFWRERKVSKKERKKETRSQNCAVLRFFSRIKGRSKKIVLK
jgi:hypothetical protein